MSSELGFRLGSLNKVKLMSSYNRHRILQTIFGRQIEPSGVGTINQQTRRADALQTNYKCTYYINKRTAAQSDDMKICGRKPRAIGIPANQALAKKDQESK